ncbi:hypothetical protein LOK49_LG15G00849 [Camellia lanceoleosa]|uniref:Uncharacterized protein n=1 Tax=Camellia lanceoleosa TaxID=1840588 RepID=A0ACC0F642_9ERIC|nr:hypothetical protein LOK49_LG15G00849 [Camellia lanceoleosa]
MRETGREKRRNWVGLSTGSVSWMFLRRPCSFDSDPDPDPTEGWPCLGFDCSIYGIWKVGCCVGLFQTLKGGGHEAYCEDNNIVGGHICLLGWPIANISNSTQLHLVATLVLDCVTRMLRPINGWSWSDAISNLPTRGGTVAAGCCRGQGIPKAKRV